MPSLAERLGPRPRRVRLAIYGCTLIAYATSLHGPFQFDDFGVIVRYAPVHSLAACWAVLGHSLRPLLKLTYAANWALGVGPIAFHLSNLALHLCNIELVMRFYSAASQREQRWPFGSLDSGAACAGFLFAVHPIQTEAVTYISGRSSSLSTCFVLLAMLLYAAGARVSKAWPWIVLAPLAYACAVLTKETTAALPLALLLWELCIERGRARAVLARQAGFWALLAFLLVVAVMHPSYYNLLYQMSGMRPLLASIWYQIDGTAYLLSRLLLVHRLSIDPGLGLRSPALVPTAIAGVALACASLLALTQVRARPVVAFGVLWFLLETFVPYVFLPRMDVLNERHMYLAGVGLFVALGALWSEHSPRWLLKPYARALTGALIVLLVVYTARRNFDYRSAFALWESTARVSPGNPRAHNNLGITYEATGRIADARGAYAKALALYPKYSSAKRNLARVEQRLQAEAPR